MHGKVLDEQGAPIPDVTISDGHQITRTGIDGTFTIQPTGPFVFLVRPAGFTAAPWFVPAATADPTFTLTAQPDPFPYRFVHVSDLHVSMDDGAALYPGGSELGSGAALAGFLGGLRNRAEDVQSVIATGDLTDLGIDDEYDALRGAVAASPLPVHLLPGNHDHIGGTAIEMVTSRNGYQLHGANPAGYERHLGPRWYSFDLPGLHVVALDWHTHELGLDNTEQDAWLRADLESIRTPWILLSHDQPWHSILDGLPSQPIATFSGHRHTSRVVRVGKTLHVNTPTPLFAGLDYSPPSYRIVRWDGEKIGLETRAVAPTGLERSTFSVGNFNPKKARWHHQISGAGHRSPVRVDGDRVIVGVKREDEASGAVEVLSLADGSLQWRAELRSSVKGTPAVDGRDVLAVEASGDVVRLDGETGAEQWRVPSPDPLRLFAWSAPLLADGTVIVGDLSHLRGLDPATGELVWQRRDLCDYQTLVAMANPILVGDTVVVGNMPAPIGLAALDPRTGETVWTLGGKTYALLGALWPIGTPLHDGDTLYVPTPSRLVAVDARTQEGRWAITTTLPFSPATPVATPDGIATVFGGRDVVLLDREDGHELWRTPIDGSSHLAMASYTRTPQLLFAGPTAADSTLLVSGLNGRLYALDARTGKLTGDVEVGAPLAAPVVLADDLLLTIGVDGTVTALDRSALL